MRVYIGPYCHFWGPYQIAHLLQHVGVSKERTTDIGEFLANTPLRGLCQWVYDKRKRKIKVHIDNYDAWNADNTLALIILPLLEKLKEDKYGYPVTDKEDVPEEIWSADPSLEDDQKYSIKRWEWILEEMIFAFKSVSNDYDEDSFYDESYNWDREGHEKHMERVKNGLRLFGKYYISLWS